MCFHTWNYSWPIGTSTTTITNTHTHTRAQPARNDIITRLKNLLPPPLFKERNLGGKVTGDVWRSLGALLSVLVELDSSGPRLLRVDYGDKCRLIRVDYAGAFFFGSSYKLPICMTRFDEERLAVHADCWDNANDTEVITWNVGRTVIHART